MSTTEIRGILIDPFAKEVKEIFYQHSLDNLYKILQCKALGFVRGEEFDIIIDDEGFLLNKEFQTKFMLERSHLFASRCLITSTNKKRQTVSLDPNITVKEIERKIHYLENLETFRHSPYRDSMFIFFEY